MNGGENAVGDKTPMSEDYVRKAVQFVVNLHAATINMRLYPETSSMVTETLEKATGILEELLQETDSFSVSALENSVLINDTRLEEVEQQKAPVRAFISWMTERGLTSIEFKADVSSEEVRVLLELVGRLIEDSELRERLPDELSEKGVENILVNQRVYVALDSGDGAEGGLRRATPMDALKDELLIRYLMGKVDLGSVQDKELVEVLSDRGKVGGLLSTFLVEEGAEEGIVVRSKKADDALTHLAEMVEAIEDEGLRGAMREQVGGIISEMSPKEMTSILSGSGPEEMDIKHVRQNVITMLKDEQLMDMVDSLIDEYIEMKREAGELDTAWTQEKLQNLNDLLLVVRGGERGGTLSDAIDEKLDEAGVAEERDASTGVRVLSAYDLLGRPLGEEDIPDLGEGIDGTVPDQINRLYGMGENDLAEGLLVKLSENLKAESPKVRRFASALIRGTLDAMEPAYCLLASEVLKSGLVDAVAAEEDYEAFAAELESVAKMAQLLINNGRAKEASDLLELISKQNMLESGKSGELLKHAGRVTERLKGPDGAIDAVALLSEEDEEKRIASFRALASLGPDGLSPLVGMVRDRGEVELRDRALETLRAVGPVGAQALMMELGRENPWYIYRNVLNLLAGWRSAEVIEAVTAMVIYPDERIRREAVWSLARIGDASSLAVVQGAANDTSPTVRRTAVRVLGMFGDASVAGFLFSLVEGEGPRGKEEEHGVAEAAILALGDLGDRAFVPRLVELIGKGGVFKKGKPEEVRAAACIALGAIGDESALPHLLRATKDPSMMVSSSAEKAIGRIQGVVTRPQPVPPGEVTTTR